MTSDALNDFAKQETFQALFFRVHALRWKRTDDNRLVALVAEPISGHYQLVEIKRFRNGNNYVRIIANTPSFNEAVMAFNKEQGVPVLDPLDSY